jgi:hypothetical protein
MTGVELIAAERKRQIEEEGFTAEYDDQYSMNELARLAAGYAIPSDERELLQGKGIFRYFLSSNEMEWQATPGNRIRELTKAGALIVAEIDRLQRVQK